MNLRSRARLAWLGADPIDRRKPSQSQGSGATSRAQIHRHDRAPATGRHMVALGHGLCPGRARLDQRHHCDGLLCGCRARLGAPWPAPRHLDVPIGRPAPKETALMFGSNSAESSPAQERVKELEFSFAAAPDRCRQRVRAAPPPDRRTRRACKHTGVRPAGDIPGAPSRNQAACARNRCAAIKLLASACSRATDWALISPRTIKKPKPWFLQ